MVVYKVGMSVALTVALKDGGKVSLQAVTMVDCGDV